MTGKQYLLLAWASIAIGYFGFGGFPRMVFSFLGMILSIKSIVQFEIESKEQDK